MSFFGAGSLTPKKAGSMNITDSWDEFPDRAAINDRLFILERLQEDMDAIDLPGYVAFKAYKIYYCTYTWSCK